MVRFARDRDESVLALVERENRERPRSVRPGVSTRRRALRGLRASRVSSLNDEAGKPEIERFSSAGRRWVRLRNVWCWNTAPFWQCNASVVILCHDKCNSRNWCLFAFGDK